VSLGNVVQYTSLDHNIICIYLRESGQGLEVKACLVVVVRVGSDSNQGKVTVHIYMCSRGDITAGRMLLRSIPSISRGSALS